MKGHMMRGENSECIKTRVDVMNRLIPHQIATPAVDVVSRQNRVQKCDTYDGTAPWVPILGHVQYESNSTPLGAIGMLLTFAD